jgi:hypothetical protein
VKGEPVLEVCILETHEVGNAGDEMGHDHGKLRLANKGLP